MSYLVLSIIFYVLCGIQSWNQGAKEFTMNLFHANGSAVSMKVQQRHPVPIWVRLRSTGGPSSKVYWLRLKPKHSNYFPMLIKQNRSDQTEKPMHTQFPGCLYSAASHLILHSPSPQLLTDEQIREVLPLLLTLSSRFQPTEFLTVSLCDGISGVVQLHNSTNFVRLHSNQQHTNIIHLSMLDSTFFHEKLVDPLGKSLINLADKSLSRLKRFKRSSFQMPVRNMSGPWLVELYMIVDSRIERINAFNDYYNLLNRITTIINYINMAFSEFNIYFTITQLEIWKHDQIVLTDENHILMELQLYKRRFISKRHDCLHAILGGDLGTSRRGQSEPASMCGYNTCVGYTKDYADPNDIEISHSVLHEIGHNFGLHHDTEQCQCYGCIMATGVEFGSSNFRWSNCSKREMASLLKIGIADCLRDRPLSNLAELRPIIMEPNHVMLGIEPKSTAKCGNGVVDDGEQCDCGARSSCQCCESCQFKSGATCAGGSCCDLSTCSIKNRGEQCGTFERGSCDLPEFCDGKSEWCPLDVYKQDGAACTTSLFRESSYCYRGECHTRNSRCQVLWGDTAYEASRYCYNMNKEGDLVKNCGIEIPRQVDRDRQPRNWNRIKCTDENTICGRLWCSHDNERVLRSSSHIPVDEIVNGEICSAVKFDMDWFLDELGMVPNGASCSSGKVCWKGSCVSVSSIRMGNCYCHGHGVCNNFGHCHCDPGFAPPNCTTAGDGGSVDSGPPSKFRISFRTITASVIIVLILILTALIIAAFIYHYRNHTWPLILNTIKCPQYRIVQVSIRSCIKRDRKIKLDPVKNNESCVTLLSDIRVDAGCETDKAVCDKNNELAETTAVVGNDHAREPHYNHRSQKIQTSEGQHPKFKRPLVLNIDVKHDVDRNHRSSIHSPRSPEKLCAKPLSVKETAKCLEKITNNPTPQPLTVKPTTKAAVQDGSNHKSTPLNNSYACVTKPNISNTKKPTKLVDQKPEGVLSPNRPPILSKKPEKNTKEPTEPVSRPPVATKTVNVRVGKPVEPQSKLQSKPQIGPNKVLIPNNQKPNFNTTKSDTRVPSSKVLRDTNEKEKLPPISVAKPPKTFDNKALPPAKTEKPPKPQDIKVHKSSQPVKHEISQPRLEHTSNQQATHQTSKGIPSVGLSRTPRETEKRPPIMCDKPPKQNKGLIVESEKPNKPLEATKDAHQTKSSKIQISQPRLEQTTCTDATRDLPTTDKTLTRNIEPHKILKCEPSKAVKYL